MAIQLLPGLDGTDRDPFKSSPPHSTRGMTRILRGLVKDWANGAPPQGREINPIVSYIGLRKQSPGFLNPLSPTLR